MEPQQSVPSAPSPSPLPPQPKPWHQHQGLRAIAALVVIAASVIWFALNRLPETEQVSVGGTDKSILKQENINRANATLHNRFSIKGWNPESKEVGHLFSNDGARVAVIFEKGDKRSIMVNGIIQNEGTKVGYNQPMFTPAGDLVYTTFSDWGGKQSLNINMSVISGNYDDPLSNLWPPSLSEDGKHMGYLLRRDDGYYPVIDGKEYGPYEYASAPTLSPNGSRSAFVISKNRQYFAVIDGKEYGPYAGEIGFENRSSLDRDYFVFSPDSSKVAYVTNISSRSRRSQLWINGAQYAEYGHIDVPVFSPDSRRIAYPIIQPDSISNLDRVEYHVAVDMEVQALAVDSVKRNSITFSPDSSKVAYIALDHYQGGDNHFVVENGVAQKTYSDVRELSYSPDSKTLAYFAAQQYPVSGSVMSNDVWLVMNGREKSLVTNELDLQADAMSWVGPASPIIWSPRGDTYAYVMGEVKQARTEKQDDRGQETGIEGLGLEVVREPSYDMTDVESYWVEVNGTKGRVFDAIGETSDWSKPYWTKSTLRFSPDGRSIEYGVLDKGDFYWVTEKLY